MQRETIELIREIYGTSGFIPLHEPRFTGREREYVDQAIQSTFVSSVGEFVDRFEEMLGTYLDTLPAVALVNGTSAIHLALHMLGIRPGDLVLTSPLSFVATANAISYCGATPLFLDIERSTLGLSPVILEQYLEENTEMREGQCFDRERNQRISACVPVHAFGHPCRIDEITRLCGKYHIPVVEDAAEAAGSRYKGKHCGTFAGIGAFSFNGNKVITAGGGGALAFSDQERRDRAKHLSTQAKEKHPRTLGGYSHDAIGFNYRMPNLNAALLVAQMEKLDEMVTAKRKLADRYRRHFESIDGIEFIEEPPDARSNYWLNGILLPDQSSRDDYLKISNDAGVMTRPAWDLLSDLEIYSDAPRGDLHVARDIASRLINLPSSVPLSPE